MILLYYDCNKHPGKQNVKKSFASDFSQSSESKERFIDKHKCKILNPASLLA